jgi:hypothetical protein
MIPIPIRYVERRNDGSTSYQVKRGQFYLGEVVRLRPGAWGVTGSGQEFSTRREAGEYLAATQR